MSFSIEGFSEDNLGSFVAFSSPTSLLNGREVELNLPGEVAAIGARTFHALAAIRPMKGTVDAGVSGEADTDGSSKVSADGEISYEGDYGKVSGSVSGSAERDRDGNISGSTKGEVRWSKDF